MTVRIMVLRRMRPLVVVGLIRIVIIVPVLIVIHNTKDSFRKICTPGVPQVQAQQDPEGAFMPCALHRRIVFGLAELAEKASETESQDCANSRNVIR